MKKIIEYTLVSGLSERDFNAEINALIKAGWQPFDSLQIGGDSGDVYVQAMVRYEEAAQ